MVEGVKLASPSTDEKETTNIKMLFWLMNIFKIIAVLCDQHLISILKDQRSINVDQKLTCNFQWLKGN